MIEDTFFAIFEISKRLEIKISLFLTKALIVTSVERKTNLYFAFPAISSK